VIRLLRLRDWRNYADVELRLDEGVTFVVATNGVGKTSMIEAARWALFGVIGPAPEAAVRVGADSAEAGVELIVPSGRVLSITRRLVRTRSRNAFQPAPEVRLDGVQVQADDLPTILLSEFEAEPTFLARLTMPALDRNNDKPHTLGLEHHLGQLFGIDSLRSALAKLDMLKKANDRDMRGIKQANAASAKRLAELSALVDSTAAAAVDLAQRFDTAQRTADQVRDWFRVEDARTVWAEQAEARSRRLEALANGATQLLDRRPTADTLGSDIRHAITTVDEELSPLRVEAAVAAARAEAIAANTQRLDDSHADCPVCRRPLDEATVDTAHAQAQSELDDLRRRRTQLAELEAALTSRRRALIDLQAELNGIAPLPPEPEHPGAVVLDSGARDKAAQTLAQAMDALVEARAAATQAGRDLDAAKEADEAMRELERLFRREAKLRVASETTKATLDEVLETTVGPIASEVNQRWTALFPDRGALTTRADGTMTRRVNGHDVPFDSFSTGEGMSATILLRLVVAHVASKADFVWFDEPLEHLDPDVRRHVANMLSRVTSGEGRVRQVVVTTYEEPLARQLRARDSERVHLVDVRQTTTDA